MPPTIALTLCIFIIAVLFVADFRRREQVSLAIWIPILWVMYCGSRPLSYWFEPGLASAPNASVEGSPIDRNFLSVLMIVGLAILYRRRLVWSRILKDNRWILVFFFYMAFSVLWSDYYEVSMKRWFRTAGDLTMVLVVLTETNPTMAIKAVFRRSAYVLLPLSIVLIKYYRGIGIAYTEDGSMTMWTGVTTHKNVLGYVAMVFGLFSLYNIVADWKRERAFDDVLLLALSIWLLAGSSSASSKTSFFCFMLGASVLMVYHLSAKNPKKIGKYLFAAAVIVFLLSTIWWAFSESVFESVVRASGRDTTLTGRTDIWEEVLEIGPGNLLVGRGYGSFWLGERSNSLWEKFFAGLHQSHNGYVDIYVELGLVGILLLVCVILSSYRKMNRRLWRESEYGILKMALLLIILIHNITESSFARPTHFLWFLFLLICINIERVEPHGDQPRPI